MGRRPHLGLLACVAAAVCGCGEPGPRRPGWAELQSLTPAQGAQAQRAQEARDALFGALFARLSSALADGGPGAAVRVCKEEAPRIAAAVGTEHRVRIGRTSLRLRNPGNAPPDWAQALVARRTEEPVRLAHADGRLAALLPIRTMPTCVGCHGPPDELAPGVRTALAHDYPDDAATGFRAGDLRGWFWVEVPAPGAPPP